MKNSIKNSLIPFLLLVVLLPACKDKYTEQYLELEPVYMGYQEFRASVKMVSRQDLVKPGKIYVVGNYLFINERMKGIHMYNNANPASPQYIGFINIPGNVDIVVKNNVMYADSYIDLVAIDITNPAQAREVGRIKSIFPYSVPPSEEVSYRTGQVDDTKGVVVGWNVKTVRKEINTTSYPVYPIYYSYGFSAKMDALSSNAAAGAHAAGASAAGVGGSMARFGLTGNNLVAVDNHT